MTVETGDPPEEYSRCCICFSDSQKDPLLLVHPACDCYMCKNCLLFMEQESVMKHPSEEQESEEMYNPDFYFPDDTLPDLDLPSSTDSVVPQETDTIVSTCQNCKAKDAQFVPAMGHKINHAVR